MQTRELGDLNPALRFDAEFFSKPALHAVLDIRRCSYERLGDIAARIQHPIEVKREYEDEGLLTIMAKDVRPNRSEISDPRYMPAELRPTVSRNRLSKGDVLVTRTGANYGQVAPWKHTVEAFACADILIIRKPSCPSGFLSSFLESSKGKPLVLRGGYGAAQPHIAPPYLSDIPVPRLEVLENRIDALVDKSVALETKSAKAVTEAEYVILDALGLADWTPPKTLSYTASASAAFAAGRIDSQYFRPLFTEVEDRLRAGFKSS
ncbi:hypothetical protein K7H91_25360 [Martelella mediterranea]|uniref:hypothetical protein n=1 Tax=Martelella mediterranea TaxID=293089 RepID=UPI001E41FB3F|nr:hypothetical protein [Martelella mediterranea]MCD1637072.1 hypothetical protein [Martelella mediterranea]